MGMSPVLLTFVRSSKRDKSSLHYFLGIESHNWDERQETPSPDYPGYKTPSYHTKTADYLSNHVITGLSRPLHGGIVFFFPFCFFLSDSLDGGTSPRTTEMFGLLDVRDTSSRDFRRQLLMLPSVRNLTHYIITTE